MKKLAAKLVVLFTLVTVLVAVAVVAVSASTSTQPNNSITSVMKDRNFYLLPGTRNAYREGWQTLTLKASGANSFAGADFAAGDAYWWDFDYYWDENVAETVDIRVRVGDNKPIVFKITSAGKVSTKDSAYFTTNDFETAFPGYGWHHVGAKYFQTHTQTDDGTYSYRYGLTLYLNGKEIDTTYVSDTNAETFVSKGFHLYSHNGTDFVTNSVLYTYFYGNGKATTSGNTTNYLLMRDLEVAIYTDAQHAEKYPIVPVNYKDVTSFPKNETISASDGDAVQVPAGFTAFKEGAEMPLHTISSV